MATRPTSDRLRETLFNVLAPRIGGSRFADLYAGSGAVGIEALSRGAAHVFFAEKAPPAIAAIRDNLRTLGVPKGFTLEAGGTATLLNAIATAAGKGGHEGSGLDLVFLDPPWEAAAEYTATLSLLGGSLGRTLLAPGALIIVEHAARTRLPVATGALRHTRTLKQGDAALSFYEPPAGEAAPSAPGPTE
ncbi:MAG: 16S rRNA (guanine(966)-N(2))-methyltransferase RsmD [Acidobacteriaceae bacterium]